MLVIKYFFPVYYETYYFSTIFNYYCGFVLLLVVTNYFIKYKPGEDPDNIDPKHFTEYKINTDNV